MEWKQIRQLDEKYWKADTTIDEEKQLRKQIISSDDPQKDPQEVEYFKILEQFSSVKLDDQFDDRLLDKITGETPKKRFLDKNWFQMAASVTLVLGILGGLGFHSYKEQQLARQQEAREAFEIAKSALFMVSEKMNKGSRYALDGLSKFEETHQKIKVQNYNN